MRVMHLVLRVPHPWRRWFMRRWGFRRLTTDPASSQLVCEVAPAAPTRDAKLRGELRNKPYRLLIASNQAAGRKRPKAKQ
jgi:hypothetical protein